MNFYQLFIYILILSNSILYAWQPIKVKYYKQSKILYNNGSIQFFFEDEITKFSNQRSNYFYKVFYNDQKSHQAIQLIKPYKNNIYLIWEASFLNNQLKNIKQFRSFYRVENLLKILINTNQNYSNQYIANIQFENNKMIELNLNYDDNTTLKTHYYYDNLNRCYSIEKSLLLSTFNKSKIISREKFVYQYDSKNQIKSIIKLKDDMPIHTILYKTINLKLEFEGITNSQLFLVNHLDREKNLFLQEFALQSPNAIFKWNHYSWHLDTLTENLYGYTVEKTNYIRKNRKYSFINDLDKFDYIINPLEIYKYFDWINRKQYKFLFKKIIFFSSLYSSTDYLKNNGSKINGQTQFKRNIIKKRYQTAIIKKEKEYVYQINTIYPQKGSKIEYYFANNKLIDLNFKQNNQLKIKSDEKAIYSEHIDKEILKRIYRDRVYSFLDSSLNNVSFFLERTNSINYLIHLYKIYDLKKIVNYYHENKINNIITLTKYPFNKKSTSLKIKEAIKINFYEKKTNSSLSEKLQKALKNISIQELVNEAYLEYSVILLLDKKGFIINSRVLKQ